MYTLEKEQTELPQFPTFTKEQLKKKLSTSDSIP